MSAISTPLIPPRFSPKSTPLIPPYLSRHDISSGAMWGGACMEMVKGEIARLFLLSHSGTNKLESINPITYKPIKRQKRAVKKITKRPQWKYTTRSETIKHDEAIYDINSIGSGVLVEIMHKTISQLDVCIAKWSRVLVVRFDLHQEFYTRDNKYVSRFIESLRKQLQRKYGLYAFGYVWVRELERSKYQHYHFAVYLDGNKIRHSSRFLTIVRSIWKNIDDKNHVPVIKNPYYFVDDIETKREAIDRISYLAKGRGKGYTGKYCNDYSTSRLTAKT